MTTIGFIGLGNMGGPMAANLVEAGHTVRGFDVVDDAKKAAAEAGVEVQGTAGEAAQGCDVILTSLPNGGLVDTVVSELLEADSTVRTFVDFSTIAVSEAQEIAEKVAQAGSRFLDALVSGGIKGAAEGTLAFMVGGDEAAFEEVRPLLEVMGRSVTHCGNVGTGQAVKACNNMILAVQQIVLSEALVLGERLGLSNQAFFDVVSNATGNSWSLSVNAPIPDVVPTSPANNNFKPGFAATLMLKDLNLAMKSAEETGTDTVLGRIARDQYAAMVDNGDGGLDFSAIIHDVQHREGPTGQA